MLREGFSAEKEYKAGRDLPRWWSHARKPLTLFYQQWFGWRWRVRFLRWSGVRIRGSYIGRECLFDQEVPELITVEANVTISSRVIVMAHDSHRGIVAPIRICRGAFIGAGAIILPGVVVGEGAVVGAGAVVTKSVPAGEVAVGNPARLLRRESTNG